MAADRKMLRTGQGGVWDDGREPCPDHVPDPSGAVTKCEKCGWIFGALPPRERDPLLRAVLVRLRQGKVRRVRIPDQQPRARARRKERARAG